MTGTWFDDYNVLTPAATNNAVASAAARDERSYIGADSTFGATLIRQEEELFKMRARKQGPLYEQVRVVTTRIA